MIYIVSDLHSDIKRTEQLIAKARSQYGTSPGENDILLVLGDLFDPLNSRLPKTAKFRANIKFLGWLSKQPFDVVTIRGNRETPKLLSKLRGEEDSMYEGQVLRLSHNIVVLEDGQGYWLPINEKERLRVLALGGALSHIVRFKPLSFVEELPYRRKYMLLKYAEHGNKADIILSHDLPESKMGILKLLFGYNVINEELDDVMANTDYYKWLFGHHHMDIRPAKNFRGVYKDILCIGTREDIFKI